MSGEVKIHKFNETLKFSLKQKAATGEWYFTGIDASFNHMDEGMKDIVWLQVDEWIKAGETTGHKFIKGKDKPEIVNTDPNTVHDD